MKKLLQQIIKFGAVGAFCFLIDYVVLFVCKEFIGFTYMTSSVISFTVSVVVNYILSVTFVFETKKDANKQKEFILFVVLSIIGLGINQAIMWFGVEIVIRGWVADVYNAMNSEGIIYTLMGFVMRYDYMFIKIIATGIVMVYNFISRKIFLEDRSK